MSETSKALADALDIVVDGVIKATQVPNPA
jgi:hypothetical protein